MADRAVVDIGGGQNAYIREIAGRVGMNSLTDDTASRVFKVEGTTSPQVARDAILTQDGAGTFYDIFAYDGLNLNDLSYSVMDSPTQWEFTCNYSNLPKKGGFTVSIDTTGGLVRTTAAYAQTAFPAAGEMAPDFGTAVDVQEGRAEGAEIVIPALKINIQAVIDQTTLGGYDPLGYAKLIASLTGYTNSGPYLTFDAGELLFAGATGPIISDKDPALNFAFYASSNLTGVDIGPISGITKAGHDYLWFSMKPEADTNGFSIQKPRAAYVSRVYGSADFSALQIGAGG